jgi:hypothetical protein
LVVYARVTLAARTRRLALPLWVLSATWACIWPQPVTEEPTTPPPTDVAPAIQDFPNPSGKIQPGQGCIATVTLVTVTSPLSLQLTARFYINYPTPPRAPIHIAGQVDQLLHPPPGGDMTSQNLSVQIDMSSPEIVNQLQINQPNILWLWVSDGFSDVISDGGTDVVSPTAAPGRYSTSTSWWIDFSSPLCNPF